MKSRAVVIACLIMYLSSGPGREIPSPSDPTTRLLGAGFPGADRACISGGGRISIFHIPRGYI